MPPDATPSQAPGVELAPAAASDGLGLLGHAAFWASALLWFGPDFWARRLPYLRDSWSYFLPYRLLLARALREGRLPEWTPLAFEGHPLLVDPNYSLFHPLSWLVVLFPDARGFALLGAACSLLGAYGAARLAAQLGVGRAGQVVAGLCFAWCGTFVSLLETGQFVALAMLPWSCVSLAWLGAKPGRRALVVAALGVAAAVLSGTPELGACGICFGGLLALTGESEAPIARRLPWLCAALLLGLAVSAVQVLPTALFLRQSTRAGGWSFAQATASSLHPLRLLGLPLPSVAGDFDLGEQRMWAGLTGQSSQWVEELSCGLLPVALALVGAAALRSRAARALGVAGLVLLLPAFGSTTAVSSFLWRHVALLRVVRFPEKLAIPLALVIAVFAGAGWERLRRPLGAPPLRLLLALLAGAGAAACALWPPAAGFGQTVAASAQTELSLLAAALLALAWTARGRTGGGILCAAALALDLIFPALRLHHRLDEAELFTPPPALAVLNADAGSGDPFYRVFVGSLVQTRDLEGDDSVPRPVRLHRLRRSALYGAAPMLDGVRLARGYSGFTSGPMHDLFSQGPGIEVLQLLGVRYAIEYGSGTASPFPGIGFTPLAELPGPVRIWKNPSVGPRVLLADALLRGRTAGALPLCPGHLVVWLSPADADQLPAPLRSVAQCSQLAAAPPAIGRAEVVAEGPERIELAANLGEPALLVLTDATDAGWSALVDGQPAPTLAADGALRAVALLPGNHRIDWRYRTPGLRAGAVISLLSLCALALLWRRRPARA